MRTFAISHTFVFKHLKSITFLFMENIVKSHIDLSDDAFVSEFKNCTLPPNLFNHEAHLRLAWIHLKKEGLEKATTSICNQLLRYVNHFGESDKFNKTLTIAAVKIVYHFIQKSKTDNFFDFILRYPELKKGFKKLINAHYSFDIFTSEKAKTEYLTPDLLLFE